MKDKQKIIFKRGVKAVGLICIQSKQYKTATRQPTADCTYSASKKGNTVAVQQFTDYNSHTCI